MYIIFESRLYPEAISELLRSKSKVSLDYAAHYFSGSVYKGLLDNNQSVSLMNVPNVGAYPLLNELVRMPCLELDSGINISFWNLLYFKRGSILLNEYQYINSIMHGLKDEEVVLLVYNFKNNRFLNSVKRRWPRLRICMLVTDLPEYMDATKKYSLFTKLFKRNRTKKEKKYEFPAVDGYIFLAPKMAERISLNGRPWMQMEGIFSPENDMSFSKKVNYKTVVYTGNLNARYGILDLVEAFSKINDSNYRLKLCGAGDSVEAILRAAEKDNRIEYLGMLPRAKAVELQKTATLLVNPRHKSEPYTQYSFPSKTMEYLASGTPVLMHHLASIPSDYDKHIFYLRDESVEAMTEAIINICSKPEKELEEFGEKAKAFIYENKTAEVQMKRAIDFMMSL
jgi:glycosyltransferase involved in cell wall biosynthesis